MGTCGQPGYVFRDFCLKQGIEFISFCLKQGIFSWTINSLRDSVDQAVNSFVIANGLNKERVSIFIIVLHRVWFRVKCLKQGIKNRNSVLNRVGKSAIFVLNRVRVLGAWLHLPTQGYIEYPQPPGEMTPFQSCV